MAHECQQIPAQDGRVIIKVQSGQLHAYRIREQVLPEVLQDHIGLGLVKLGDDLRIGEIWPVDGQISWQRMQPTRLL